MNTIPISQINVGDRMRSELGDISRLAESLKTHGLIQPIVLTPSNELIAGGRRLAAAKSLGWTEIAYVTRDTPEGESQLRELELEENVRRKQMTWQENVLAIARIHRLKSMNAALTGLDWGQAETGELLGCTAANVSYALTVAKTLESKDAEIYACGSAKEALQLLMKRREDAVVAALAKRAIPASVQAESATPSLFSDLASDDETPEPKINVPISQIAVHSDCIVWMDASPAELVDHIVTDPPYGIEMSNLSQENTGMDISRIEDEHDVASNLSLFEMFFPRAYKLLKPSGFCVIWCDAVHFSLLSRLANLAGFRTQRWPLVWAKTHSCINQAAQYNYTKATEFALVCRKPNSVLATHQHTNYILASNDEKTGGSPFAKPETVWSFIYSAIATPGQTVLDPFAGAGSSLVAAVKHGLKPLLVESNDTQFNHLTLEVRRVYSIYFPELNLV